MNRIILAAILFASSIGIAAPSNSSEIASKVYDLMFLPTAGHFALKVSYFNPTSKDSVSSSGAIYDEVNLTQSYMNFDLAYGIFQGLALSLSAQHFFQDQMRTAFGAASAQSGVISTITSTGISDLETKLTYRFLGANPADFFRSDVFAAISPSTIISKSGSQTSDGTEGRGGVKATVGGRLGGMSPTFSFYLTAYDEMNTLRTVYDATSNLPTLYDGGDKLNFGGQVQFSLGEFIQLNGGMIVTYVNPLTITAPGLITNYPSHNYSTIEVSTNFNLWNDFMLQVVGQLVTGISYNVTIAGVQMFDSPSVNTNYGVNLLTQF